MTCITQQLISSLEKDSYIVIPLTSQSNHSASQNEFSWEALVALSGLPYWRIYRQIPDIWRILKAFGYKYFGLAIWGFFESIWLQTFWFGKMYDMYICTYLLTNSYLGLQFEIRGIKGKRDTFENSSVVLNISYKIWLQTVETHYSIQKYLQNVENHTLSGKTQDERQKSCKWMISSEKNWCFGKDATISRSLAMFCWVSLQFFLSGNAVHLHSVSVSINRMMSPSNAVDLESPLIATLPLHQVGQCHTHLRTSRVVSNEHRYDSKARVLFFHDNP